MVYNGTQYRYITNLQGDIVEIRDANDSTVVRYTYDAWGKLLTTTGTKANDLGAHNPLRYRGYVYDTETELYYLQSRYYNPTIGRFISADVLVSTGQGVLGNNMFAYCNNNPANREDMTGTCSRDRATRERFDCGRMDCPSSSNYSPYTVAMGGVLAFGIGPLSMSLQVALVTDSAGDSEIQISYSAPNIFYSGLPSVDEMLADISSDVPKYKFGASFAGTFSFTNAPSVSNLYGLAYSVGGSVSGLAVDYNAMASFF